MNIKTLYFSPTNTTEKVVHKIAETLGKPEHFNLTLPQNRKGSLIFDKEDVVIMGMPVYAGRIPKLMEDYLSHVKGCQTKCILVAVYGNRHYEDALLEMKDLMTKQGFNPVAAAAFIGEHSYTSDVAENRPDTLDLNACMSFASRIDFNKTTELIVDGNHPYRERRVQPPLGPTVEESCSKCGTCVKNCPTGALTINTQVNVEPEKCILCHACIKKCPTNDIHFENYLDHVVRWLKDNFSERRVPEYFF